MARVVLGVGGGIAAYKVCELLRLFTESGHEVRVVPTAAALRFVGAPTWEALSGQPVADDVWSAAHEVPHVRIGRVWLQPGSGLRGCLSGEAGNFRRQRVGPRERRHPEPRRIVQLPRLGQAQPGSVPGQIRMAVALQ